MSADAERLPPPNEPAAFESLCLDLWKEIWGAGSGAQKNARSGQPQAGVDVSGRQDGRWIGVQCKQKDGLLRSKLTVGELEREVGEALTFEPKLSLFILATSGPRDGPVQQRAREFTEDHESRGLFSVEVWSWAEIWHEIYQRDALLRRVLPIYWPRIYGAAEDRKVAPSRLTHVAQELFGREEELARLDEAWCNPKTHVVTLVAWGGVGKTSLVASWAAHLAERDHDGADYLDWSFYSQGTREQGGASSDSFIAAALEFFGDPDLAKSAASPWDKGARLAKLVAQRRALLVLDGLEPLQYPPSSPLAGQLKDPAITALLKGLAARNPGLCVVTTRESVADLAAFQKTTAPEWKLENLNAPAGVDLLRNVGVLGTTAELGKLVEDVRGHALTLDLLGRFLHDAHGGDVRKRELVKFAEVDAEVQGGHAFRVMSAYERWLAPKRTGWSRLAFWFSGREQPDGQQGELQLAILRLLGLFERPATADCLAALRRPPVISGLTKPLVGIADVQWNLAVSRLAGCGLVSLPAPSPASAGEGRGEGSGLDAHPLIREHFARGLREQHPEAWRAAHSRLYEHLRDSTEPFPETLEGLQPLYQAISHGCRAGRMREACETLSSRIWQGQESFSTGFLGAFGSDLGAAACFFERPWSRLSPLLPKEDRGWLFAVTGYCLSALGRLAEALAPTQASLQLFASKKDWRNAAVSASNLSGLEVMLGDTGAAVLAAEQGVLFADRSRAPFQRQARRVALAYALHQVGRRAEAKEVFEEAERMLAKYLPKFPQLYSRAGFWYCDLLLAEVERAAWRVAPENTDASAHSGTLREVEGRAHEARLAWIVLFQRGPYLSDSGANSLTLARAGLYGAILEGHAPPYPVSEVRQAVDCLRRAGDLLFLPRGLITRAWLSLLNGDEAAARADLDEAWEIAERGPMPLHLADIHLHRARLFRDKDALAQARRLIVKHGYWRRKEELEDAEEAAREW